MNRLHALLQQEFLDLHIVFDDSVVDDGKLAARADMGMGVDLARRAVRCPAGVSHTDAALKIGAAVNGVAERLQPALCLFHLQLVLLGDDRNAGGVIAAVLKPRKTVQQNGGSLLGTYKSNDSTHI